MFLDQVITADNAFLRPWKEIKASLPNEKGLIPKRYKFLTEHLTINPISLRLD
jgi:hypothetical protein